MIAVSSKAQSFRELAAYLVAGRSGRESERVAWSTGRNLPTSDPEAAAIIMRGTAQQNLRVERPVYHLVLSFDPSDAVSRADMERVADRVLARLGLSEHQAIYVAHADRAHPHVHVCVNRVHPVTARVWTLDYDYRVVQHVLRAEEVALGLRRVQGVYAVEEAHASERGLRVDARSTERDRESGRPARDAGERVLTIRERLRHELPALRAARSWDELERALGERGFQIVRRPRGLVVTDGEHFTRLSAIGREMRMGTLEERFGIGYDAHAASGRQGQPPVRAITPEAAQGPCPDTAASERARALARRLEEYEAIAALFGEQYAASHSLAEARAKLRRMDLEEERSRTTMARFERGLGRVYANPVPARAAFGAYAVQHGIEEAARVLRQEPQRFGVLRLTEHRRALGLVRALVDSDARIHAQTSATEAREAWYARVALPTPAEHDAARAAVSVAVERERGARAALPSVHARLKLQREIGRAMRQLLPYELAEFRRLVTAPRAALAAKLGRAVREAVLEREERAS